jgi:hypothetical protein
VIRYCSQPGLAPSPRIEAQHPAELLFQQKAEDLLMGAPSEVTPKQLRELHIRLNLPQ